MQAAVAARLLDGIQILALEIFYKRELKRLVSEAVVARFDHADLNADAVFASGAIPTTENLVRAIWELLVPKLGAERLHRLRLWEDPTFYVEYFGS